jgi:AcrR family transcriptional regulator
VALEMGASWMAERTGAIYRARPGEVRTLPEQDLKRLTSDDNLDVMQPPTRMSGNARRSEIVAAAVHLFAEHGYAGTTTDAVARAAGISQPYVVRLFGSKRALFVAVVDYAFEEIAGALADVPRTATPDERLAIMLEAYREITDRDELALVIVQAVGVAVDDDEVRAGVQAHVRALHKTVWSAAGGDTDRVREFFGVVMLLNTVAAIDVPELLGPDW